MGIINKFTGFLTGNPAVSIERRPILEHLETRQLLSVAPAVLVVGPVGPAPIAPITVTSTAIQPVGVTIHAVAKHPFIGTVGIIRNWQPIAFPEIVTPIEGPYTLQANITWGDGSASSKGTFDVIGTELLVNGSHTYNKAGTYAITVTVLDGPLPGPIPVSPPIFNPVLPISPIPPIPTPLPPIDLIATIHSTADVVASNGSGVTLNEIAGQSFKANLGTFEDGDAEVLTLTATINWGDGKTSTGEITADTSTGKFDVFGKHTYAKAGKYKVQITVSSRVIIPQPLVTALTGVVAQWTDTINVTAATATPVTA